MIKISCAAFLTVLLASVNAMAACPQGTTKRANFNGKDLCSFAQKKYLSTQLTLTSANNYLIERGTYIGGDNQNSSTLNIEPGTTIYANPGTFLVVMRGSSIMANGTKEQPIVFTAAKMTDRKRGEWGGLVINGNAPINACRPNVPVCEAISEGIKEEEVKFGGNNAADSSGRLTYVRVEFGGYPIAPDNELNGITFNGVGNKTEVDYIQVHMNADDGVEFFGGTVNAKHLVLTANDDDSLDWDMGWQGKVQFVLIQQADDVADTGFEADNLKSPMDASPRSNPTISNVTMLGGKTSTYGMLLRRGTSAKIYNVAVTGFKKACLDIDDAATFSSGIVMEHNIFACDKPFETDADDVWALEQWFNTQAGNKVTTSLQLNGYVPEMNSPLLRAGKALTDNFFAPVDFVGAIRSAQEDWTVGWTNYASK